MTAWDETARLLGAMKPNAPATEEAVAAAQRDLGVIFPDDYVEFLRHADGAEGLTTVGAWLALYPLAEVLAATQDLRSFDDRFRPLVVLASDGGEEDYVLDPRRTPPQIYEWELFSPEPFDGRPVGSTLRELLTYTRNV